MKQSINSVINATGVVVHTNLGRAPLGEKVAERLSAMAMGYSNLEYDLQKCKRGNRQRHLKALFNHLTGAEDMLVVNNNAAALLLVFRTLADGREVVVSRGELIEIGDSFRLPEIMTDAGAKLVTVGTTNITRPEDYAGAITDETAVLLRVHTSNFNILGKSHSVSDRELAELACSRGLIMVNDLGSGMLRCPEGVDMESEPTVAEAIEAGADLVTFSGDKLLGGPQAGIVSGRADLVKTLARSPIMRALRPGKLTLAALETAAMHYLDDEQLKESNPVFRMLARTPDQLRESAQVLSDQLVAAGVENQVVESFGQVGGGALPGTKLPGWAVVVVPQVNTRKEGELYAEKAFEMLQQRKKPVLAVLREGKLLFDLRTLSDEEIPALTEAMADTSKRLNSSG